MNALSHGFTAPARPELVEFVRALARAAEARDFAALAAARSDTPDSPVSRKPNHADADLRSIQHRSSE
ncbi:MAG: hypothetical protein U5M50_02105 [Sphingobium sp.]|nr:hypothetical protein [Sphingobium sp.]